MPRAIWKGAINFGLVTIPVGLYTATDNKTPKFKQLRKTDHSPIRYKRVAEADGKEVEWEDIVKGYEFEKDRYVVFTDEELDSAHPDGNKLIDVVQFVDESEIDPMYYKSSYYLAPEKTGVKAYKILEEALQLRHEIAREFEVPSWAHHRLEERMAKGPERVSAFYDSLIPPLTQQGTLDMAARSAAPVLGAPAVKT